MVLRKSTRPITAAVGHFMDHRYFDFDAPLRVEPPVAGSP